MQKITKYKNQLIVLGISILASLFFCYPMLNKLNMVTHDLPYHLTRIQQIASQLQNFQIPVLIHSGLLDGLGYANSIFYPEIFLYIPAILHLLGFNTMNAYKIFMLMVTWATFMSMFISTKKIFQSNSVGIIASLLYTFALYRITDVYMRGTLAETLVFLFLPIVVWGCYELTLHHQKKWWILPIGIFGVANSHIISLAFTVGMVFFFLLMNIKRFWKEKERIKYVILSGVVSILIILSVVLPILEQKSQTKYKVFEGETSKDLGAMALIPTQIFQNKYQAESPSRTEEGIAGKMCYGVGILLLILPTFILFIKEKGKRENKFAIQLIILGTIALIGVTQIFPWKYFKFLNVIQFPWRLNSIVTICLAMAGAYCAYEAFGKRKELMYLLAIMIVCVTTQYLDNINYTNEIYLEQEYQDIGSGEYLPSIGVNRTENKVFNIDDKNIEFDAHKENGKIEFYVTKEKNGERINIPFTYYKGYVAEIEKKDGKKEKLELNMNQENGLIELKNSNHLEGKVIVQYKMTLIQRISYFISYGTLFCTILYAILKSIKKKKY